MSCLIQEKDNYFFQLNQPLSIEDLCSQTQILGNQLESGEKKSPMPKYLHAAESTLLTSSSEGLFSKFFYHAKNIYKNISAIATVCVDKKNLTLILQIKLLNQQNQYVQIKEKQRKKMVLKLLSKKSTQRDCKIIIGHSTGEVSLCFPFYYHFRDLSSEQIAKNVQRIIKDLVYSLKFNFGLLETILQTSKESHLQEIDKQTDKNHLGSFLKNYQYQKIMNLQIYFPYQCKQDQESLKKRILNEKKSENRIKYGFVPLHNQFLFLEIYSYSLINNYTHQSIQHSLFISKEQREKIKSKIELPSLPKQRIFEQQTKYKDGNKKVYQQNPYILNHIIVKKVDLNNKMRKINSGGFTDIYLAQVSYWQIRLYGIYAVSDISQIISQPPMKKCLVIKRQNNEVSKGERNRIVHQKYILKKMKNGLNFFFCKYYLPHKCPQLEGDLLSDYIDFPNFREYCMRHSEVMSLHTKIYFSFVISQSLRYLKQYKIVHLDLKPSNIMISQRLMIKLIDFGESFHPDLVNHLPGFSVPYSAPENYTEEQHFTHKNDVFSLGVIMYELFFGKDPFFFHRAQFREQVYNQGNFFDYLYFCPEQCKLAGQHIVFPLIQSIIMRCLHPNPSYRPQLQWIVYLLIQSLNYFY